MRTECNKCIFFENTNCLFDIHNLIDKNRFYIDTKNNTIENYRCDYAFGRNTFEEKQKIHSITIQDVIANVHNRNKIKYNLFLCDNLHNFTYQDFFKKINDLIYPIYSLNIICENINKEIFLNISDNISVKWNICKTITGVSDIESIMVAIYNNCSYDNSSCNVIIRDIKNLDYLDEYIDKIHISNINRSLKPVVFLNLEKKDLFIATDYIKAQDPRILWTLFEDPDKYMSSNDDGDDIPYKFLI